MKKGQKSVTNGIENFLCPVTDMYITQGANGSYSHKGTMAVDIRGLKSGVQYPYYAPCTVKCLKTYPSYGQAMWQSVNNVRCANGYVGIVTFMTCHDNTFDAKVGQVVKQGEQLGNMGTKGNATGVHVHFQGAQTSSTTWIKNAYGIYYFPNGEKDIDELCYMDDTNIMNCPTLKPIYVPKEQPKPVIPTTSETDTLKKEIEELKKQLSEKEKNIVDLTSKNAELTNTIISKDKEIETLKNELENSPELIFESPKSDYYAIKLNESEKLYLG